ncbi:MAG TPA: hypothetical protein VG454_17465 [Gemmatimonadales bacterium]|nr:hypothetical protein [Gemmatimonadales bacterium]
MTTTYELRPLSIGEILDGALVLLRRHFGLLLGIALLCQGVPAVLDVYIALTGGSTQNPGFSLLDRLLTAVGGVLVTGATVRVVSEAYLGRSPVFGEAMSFAGSRFGTILGANIISGFLTVLATVAFIIPGIVVACGYSVAATAAALESGSSTDALRHSWALTKGFRWKALGLFVVAIGALVIVYFSAGVLAGLGGAVIGATDTLVALVTALVSLLIYPVLSCVFTVFYYDLRVRKEGFDIEMLSNQLTAAT